MWGGGWGERKLLKETRAFMERPQGKEMPYGFHFLKGFPFLKLGLSLNIRSSFPLLQDFLPFPLLNAFP